jgi:hypothetical protein
VQAHRGLFQTADGGTLFLDEIGDMPLPLQVKLLRVLQEGEVRPLGATQSIPVDVRVISATHRDLEAQRAAELFREDLYYRLNVVSLRLPPLAERREDIPVLATHILRRLAERYHKPQPTLAPEAMALLIAATLFFGFMPGSAPVEPEKFGEAPLASLPLRTEEWLDRQRPTLPGSAMPMLDSIGMKLETLAPQLRTLNDGEPAAAEVRKLVGDHLPELISTYTSIPRHLRGEGQAGGSPDQHLVDSLGKISTEIDSVTRQLASGAIDNLAIKTRYLDYKYGAGPEGENGQ